MFADKALSKSSNTRNQGEGITLVEQSSVRVLYD